MKSFYSLIPRYIKSNKKRVFFMALGIMISMSMVVALCFIKDSLVKALYETAVYNMGGDYDLVGYSRGFLDYDKLKAEPEIKEASLVKPLGIYAVPDTKYTMDISGYENNISDLLNFEILEGAFPENEDEIAIEDWMLKLLPGSPKIGDTISLKYRIVYRDRSTTFDGKNGEHTFKITGVFRHTFRKNPDFGIGKAYITLDCAKGLLSETKRWQVEDSVYINLKPGYDVINTRKAWVASNQYGTIGFAENGVKVEFSASVAKYNLILAVIFIIICSISAIIILNIFNVSIAERTRDIGMLRAVGCPPWKIKAMILGEGLLLGVIFIPLGIILGTYATKFILSVGTAYPPISGLRDIPLNIIGIAASIGIITILAGTYFPARRASKISPVSAIVGVSGEKINGQGIRAELESTSFIMRRLNFEGKLAVINTLRNKKRFATTSASLIMTITLFIVINYVITATSPVAAFKNRFPADFKIVSKTWITKEMTDKLKGIEGVEAVEGRKTKTMASVELREENLTKEGIAKLKETSENNNYLKEQLKAGRFFYSGRYIGYNKEELEDLKQYVVEGEIDEEGLMSGQVVVMAQNLHDKNDTKLKVGDTVILSCDKYDEVGNYNGVEFGHFQICAFVSEDALGYVEEEVPSVLIMSDKVMEDYLWIYGYQKIEVYLENGADYDEVYNKIDKMFSNVRGSWVYSFKQELNKVVTDNKQLLISLYTISFIIALVCIINFINISNISALSRKKEFGALRAMGLSNLQTKKVIVYEGVFYGLVAGVISSVLGIIITFVMALKGKAIFNETIVWHLPILNILLTMCVTVIITTVCSFLSSKTLYKSNIIDSIRNVE